MKMVGHGTVSIYQRYAIIGSKALEEPGDKLAGAVAAGRGHAG